MHKVSVFLFQRDLRIIDNVGLNAAAASSDTVIPVFCFDPQQVGRGNDWRSLPGQDFLIDALEDLASEIKASGGHLGIIAGRPEKVLCPAAAALGATALFLNIDYTPFSARRRAALRKECARYQIAYNEYHDILLLGGPVTNNSGRPYKKFGPFYDHYRRKAIAPPKSGRPKNLGKGPKSIALARFRTKAWPGPAATRAGALGMLRALPKTVADYESSQNLLTAQTTHLSAWIKFGLVSIREVHAAAKELGRAAAREHFIRQLFWRDFFYNLALDDSRALKSSYDPSFENIKTKNTSTKEGARLFKLWTTGRTGFPVVDAAMRQIRAEKWMHNRARLIVASFFTRDLLFYWREGEKYFAQNLVDYDPIINNYNWQIVAGTGPFALAWYRIFSPWEQSKKFDPEAEYIKKYVPELASVPARDIHRWHEKWQLYPKVAYPPPCLDHATAKEAALKAYADRA